MTAGELDSVSTVLKIYISCPAAGVLDEPYSQLTPVNGAAVQAGQSTQAGTVSILCSLAGRYGHSVERANLSKVRVKLPLLYFMHQSANHICTFTDLITFLYFC